MKKEYFRCNSPCFIHLLLFFTGKTNIRKLSMGTSTERLWDSVVGPPGDQMMGRSGDVTHTCSLNPTHKQIKLTLAGYSRLYSVM